MKRILFLGTYLPEVAIAKIENSSQAANIFQGNLLNNLSKNNQTTILSYIGMPIPSDYLNTLKSELHKQKIEAVIANTKIAKIQAVFSYYLKLWRMGKNCDAILLYNHLHISFLVNIWGKLLGVKTYLIVADFDDYQKEENLLRKFILWLYTKQLCAYSGLIFLSKTLQNKYSAQKTFLLEGGISWNEFAKITLNRNSNVKKVVYAGLINQVTGIDIFLDMIKQCQRQDVRFIFSGRGELVSAIQALSKLDERIEYRGFLSRQDYQQLLSEAHVFINPRNMHLPENANNFPSKILEYLATGKIIISTKFPNYEKFQDHIKFCESDAQSMNKTLELVLNKYQEEAETIFDKNRIKAKKFTWDIQAIKIEEFMFK